MICACVFRSDAAVVWTVLAKSHISTATGPPLEIAKISTPVLIRAAFHSDFCTHIEVFKGCVYEYEAQYLQKLHCIVMTLN